MQKKNWIQIHMFKERICTHTFHLHLKFRIKRRTRKLCLFPCQSERKQNKIKFCDSESYVN